MKSGTDFHSTISFYNCITKKFGCETCPKKWFRVYESDNFQFEKGQYWFCSPVPPMATIEKPKKAFLGKALGNTLTGQSSWLVLLGLCGRSSKMCQNWTFRPSVGYDNDDVIGPNFLCELIGSMSSFFKIKFCSTREKPHPTVSCYLNSLSSLLV